MFTPSTPHALRLRRMIRESPLPTWCVSAIRYLAWEQGHSASQSEVDMLACEWLGDFAQSFRFGHNTRTLVPFNVQVKVEGDPSLHTVLVHGEDPDDAAVAALDLVRETTFAGEDRLQVLSVDQAFQ